ncbi:hypothetical protein [uncultured Psychrobacter sp.]|uniref:hypothetical protein n=1 Tax=uncultured Psychrobacter sp. TaxID=259303 RepID=UPI0030D99F2D
MRPIDRNFLVSSLVFGGVCILYAAVLNYLSSDIAALTINTFAVDPRVTAISVGLVQSFYWFSCSMLFSLLFSQWIINQHPEKTLPHQRLSLAKPTATASINRPE